ncbi:unnamed protein product, partial [Rotaria sp. Silwood1]
RFRNHEKLLVLGSSTVPRLAIFSFLIYVPAFDKYLHHNFVCMLLNDLFGIQVRSGCACAGPYVLELLNIDDQKAQIYTKFITEDENGRFDGLSRNMLMKPGFTRFNLSYFASDEEVDYILNALEFIANEGWKFLPLYTYDPATAVWHPRHMLSESHVSHFHNLQMITFENDTTEENSPTQQNQITQSKFPQLIRASSSRNPLDQAIAIAHNISKYLYANIDCRNDPPLNIPQEYQDFIWFILPKQVILKMLHAFEQNQHNNLIRKLCYPSWNLCEFITEILNHLSALPSFDLGMESLFFLHYWPFKIIQIPLTYLTITLSTTRNLLDIMSTEPLSRTLEQLHIKLAHECFLINSSLDGINLLPQMKALHTFSFVKSFNWHSMVEWTFVNLLTSSNVMPALRRMNFSIVISVDDLIRMKNSALFTDLRHIDVHYAFIINDDRPHIELLNYVPYGNQCHPRQIGSATFISVCWPDNQPFTIPGQIYLTKPQIRQHLFYSLPWTFNEFFQLSVPDRCIYQLEIFKSCSISEIYSSNLIKLNMSDNLASSATLFPQLMTSNKIVELHLFRCNRQVSMHLPNVSHLVLIDSLDSLNSCSLSLNIRSIQIILHYECLRLATGDWTALHSLSILPLLKSLRIFLYGMHIPPDDTSCQIIAEITPNLLDFSFCFRRIYYQTSYDIVAAYKEHCLFIEKLRKRILNLSLDEQPYVFVEKDGCGLIMWF